MLIWVRPDCGEGVFGKLEFSGVVAGDSENRQHTERDIVWSAREVRLRKIQESNVREGCRLENNRCSLADRPGEMMEGLSWLVYSRAAGQSAYLLSWVVGPVDS
jgi:hypothetical protein